MHDIKVALVGVGNCVSSLVQGIAHYQNGGANDQIGLMHWDLGGYRPKDIRFVAAWDIDSRKVGKDIAEAIFAKPNCTAIFCDHVPQSGVKVQMGRVLDGYSDHMAAFGRRPHLPGRRGRDAAREGRRRRGRCARPRPTCCSTTFRSEARKRPNSTPNARSRPASPSSTASRCSSPATETWARRFEEAGVPIVGDDIKAQLGATIVHRVLTDLFAKRGVQLDRTYQLNTGGNTDFLNMLEPRRG